MDSPDGLSPAYEAALKQVAAIDPARAEAIRAVLAEDAEGGRGLEVDLTCRQMVGLLLNKPPGFFMPGDPLEEAVILSGLPPDVAERLVFDVSLLSPDTLAYHRPMPGGYWN